MSINLSISSKERVARWVQRPFLNKLLAWAVQLIVPRQRVGVVAVVVDENGRFLMLKHVFHPHAPWGLPGGWLKRNEDPPAGVLREIKEETGLTAVIDSLLVLTHETQPSHIGIAYLAHAQATELTLSSEIIEGGWFDTDNLPAPMLTLHKTAVKTAVGRLKRDLRSVDQLNNR